MVRAYLGYKVAKWILEDYRGSALEPLLHFRARRDVLGQHLDTADPPGRPRRR